MSRRPHPRRLLALHEAAHACVYLWQGRTIDHVWITGAKVDGMAAEGACQVVPAHSRIDDFIEVSMAGYLAERRASWKGPEPLDPGYQSDLIDFFDASEVGGPDINDSIEAARRLPWIDSDIAAWFYVLDRCAPVDTLLGTLWPAIEAVADLLLRRRKLSGFDVKSAYDLSTRPCEVAA